MAIFDSRLQGIMSPQAVGGAIGGGGSLAGMMPNINLKPVTFPTAGGQTSNPMNINRSFASPTQPGSTAGSMPQMSPGALDIGAFLRQMQGSPAGAAPNLGTPIAPGSSYNDIGGQLYNIRDPSQGLNATYSRNGLNYMVNPHVAPNAAAIQRARATNPNMNYKAAGGSIMSQAPGSMGWNAMGAAPGPIGAGQRPGTQPAPGQRPGTTSPPANTNTGNTPNGGYIRPGTALGGPFQIGGTTESDPVIQRFKMLTDALGLQRQDEELGLRDRLAASGRDPAMGGGLMRGLNDLSTRYGAMEQGVLGGLLNEDESRALQYALGQLESGSSRYRSDQEFRAAQLANQLGQSRLGEERRQYDTGFPLQALGTLGPLLLGLGQFGQSGMSGLSGQLGQAGGLFPSLF